MIEWDKLEVGSLYMVEDKYHFQAKEARILKNEIKNLLQPNGKENKYIYITFLVTRPTHGCSRRKYTWCKIFDDDMKNHYLTQSMKFMPLGSMFSYATSGYNPLKDF